MIKYGMNKSKGSAPAITSSQPDPPAPRLVTALFAQLAALYPEHPLDVRGAAPFRVLVAAMLSSRTKDPVTNAAVERVCGARPPRRRRSCAIPEDELAALLKPVGFYIQKAAQLHRLCRPCLSALMARCRRRARNCWSCSGVGRKVANLVLNICFDEPAICVDTHVHRIANRLGWVVTDTPEADGARAAGGDRAAALERAQPRAGQPRPAGVPPHQPQMQRLPHRGALCAQRGGAQPVRCPRRQAARYTYARPGWIPAVVEPWM